MRMQRLWPLVAACSIMVLTGCDLDGIKHAADALDRFSAEIEKTTNPETGSLKSLVDQTSRDLKDLIHEAEKSGKAVTEDALIKFTQARQDTIAQILTLTNKIFGDTRVLIREFQGAGVSIPLQLEDTLGVIRSDLKKDLAGMITPLVLYQERDVPIDYEGVTWSIRPEGFQSVWFAIKDAKSLRLKIGDRLIAPDNGPKAGSVAYRIPISPEDDALFDDTRDMALGFQLVDVNAGGGKESARFRYGGFMRLTPRFPLRYSLTVFRPGGSERGEARVIDLGPAILNLVDSVSKQDPLKAAQRSGDIYRIAKSRLAVGTSFVSVPQGAHWELTVTFPDGKTEVLSPDKRRRENEFGVVTVSGPNRKGDDWSLMIDVELKR